MLDHPIRLGLPEGRLNRLDAKFATAAGELHDRLVTLLNCTPFRYASKPRGLPARVVYLFCDDQTPLYVGRSKKFRRRLGNHCRRSSTANQSSFAFQLARQEAGIDAASYSGPHTRKNLMQTPGFVAGFARAKVRLNSLDIRYVEEPDPLRQALLEIYCAVALETPYNDFDTH